MLFEYPAETVYNLIWKRVVEIQDSIDKNNKLLVELKSRKFTDRLIDFLFCGSKKHFQTSALESTICSQNSRIYMLYNYVNIIGAVMSNIKCSDMITLDTVNDREFINEIDL